MKLVFDLSAPFHHADEGDLAAEADLELTGDPALHPVRRIFDAFQHRLVDVEREEEDVGVVVRCLERLKLGENARRGFW